MDFSYKRLLWSEGTLLAQQHFQQWDQLQQSRDQFFYYLNKRKPREGFVSLDTDTSMLDLGIFRLNHFQAVSKEGKVLGFRVDSNRLNELALDLNAVEYAKALKPDDVLTVYIAIPKGSHSHGVSGYPKRDILKARWLAEYSPCADEMDLDRQQEILFGHLNVQLLVDAAVDFNKRKSENDLLPVAKISCSGTGRYVVKPEFVPPVLFLSASPWLIMELKNLERCLQFIEKSLILKIKDDFSDSWRSHELLKVAALLRYRIQSWLAHPNIDPDEITDTLIQSIIMIRTFSVDLGKIEIFSADNSDVYEKFSIVLGELKNIIKKVLPMHKKDIALTEGPDAWLSSSFLDSKTLDAADFYLSLNFNNNFDQNDRFIKEIKLSGANGIQGIVTQALPGLSIRHCAQDIDYFGDGKKRSYFKIDKTGLHWDDVKNTASICVFVSKQFLEVDLRLLALFEDAK